MTFHFRDRNEKRSEISLSEIKTDERSVIKNLSNASKIAEAAEKVIENAFQQLMLVKEHFSTYQNLTP